VLLEEFCVVDTAKNMAVYVYGFEAWTPLIVQISLKKLYKG
jgi:hypothetical protein